MSLIRVAIFAKVEYLEFSKIIFSFSLLAQRVGSIDMNKIKVNARKTSRKEISANKLC